MESISFFSEIQFQIDQTSFSLSSATHVGLCRFVAIGSVRFTLTTSCQEIQSSRDSIMKTERMSYTINKDLTLHMVSID